MVLLELHAAIEPTRTKLVRADTWVIAKMRPIHTRIRVARLCGLIALVFSSRLHYVGPMPSMARIRDEYLRLREVQRGLNAKLVKAITKRGFEQSARDLGFWQDGKIVLDHKDHMGVVADYALYECRVAGKTPVERYASRGLVPPKSDEHVVLEAMLDSRFTVVEIEDIIPEVGAHAFDDIYGKRFLLADVGLAKTGKKGVLLATRLLKLPKFTMTTGAPLPFDPGLAKLLVEGLRDGGSDVAALRLLPAKERRHLVRHLIGLAMEELVTVKVARKERAGRTSSRT